MDIGLSAAQYTGNAKTLYERGYMKGLNLCATGNAACSAYKPGCSCNSEASDTAFRRANVYLRFTTVASAAEAAAAETASTALTEAGGKNTFVNAISSVKAADNATFASVVVPTAAQIGSFSTPQVTAETGAASSVTASLTLAIGLAVLALRH